MSDASDRLPMSKRGKVIVGGGSALAVLLAAAVAVEPFTAQREGKANVAYHDISHPKDGRYDAGCYGHTMPYSAGMKFTDAQCDKFLTGDEQKYAREIAHCLPTTPLPFGVAKAFIDEAYNLGSGKFCRSSMSRLAKAGDLAGACRAISAYKFSGHKDCTVKANRCGGIPDARTKERALCESGLHP